MTVTAAELRERDRADVRQAALRGEHPRATFRIDQLEIAFRGHEEELAELERIADDALAARVERDRTRQRHGQLQRETARVLAEWEEQERAERRGRAEAEAKKRLGWAE